MKFVDQLERLRRIDSLIRHRATGSPSEFAEKLGVSESSLYLQLKIIKELGADYKFCVNSNSYVYKNTSVLRLGYEKV